MDSTSESSMVTIQVKASLRGCSNTTTNNGNNNNSCNSNRDSDSASDSDSNSDKSGNDSWPAEPATDIVSEGLVEIPRSLLVGEFFEAKLERWHQGSEPILFEVSPESDAAEGAALFKRRLEASAKDQDDDEAKGWSELDWWTSATTNRLGAFIAVLQIFHLALLNDFTKEVLAVFSLFRLCAPTRVVADIASAVGMECQLIAPIPVEPINSWRSLKGVMKDAGSCCDINAWMMLADRHLQGVRASAADVVEIFIDAYLSFFEWVDVEALDEVSFGSSADLPVDGRPKYNYTKVDRWFRNHFSAAFRQCPTAIGVVARKLSRQLRMTTSVTDKHVQVFCNRRRSQVPLKAEFGWVEPVLSGCCHALLVRSSLHPEQIPAIIKAVNSDGSILRGSLTCRGSTFLPRVSPKVFAVGALELQLFLLNGSIEFYEHNLKNHAHLIHERARHLLLDETARLSSKDLKFLASASFPGAEAAGPTR